MTCPRCSAREPAVGVLVEAGWPRRGRCGVGGISSVARGRRRCRRAHPRCAHGRRRAAGCRCARTGPGSGLVLDRADRLADLLDLPDARLGDGPSTAAGRSAAPRVRSQVKPTCTDSSRPSASRRTVTCPLVSAACTGRTRSWAPLTCWSRTSLRSPRGRQGPDGVGHQVVPRVVADARPLPAPVGSNAGRGTDLSTGRRTSPATSAQKAAPTPSTLIPDAATRKHTTAASRPSSSASAPARAAPRVPRSASPRPPA